MESQPGAQIEWSQNKGDRPDPVCSLQVVEYPNDSKSLKLGDFGLAVEVTEPLYTVCGTPTYVAPEILNESGYGLKVSKIFSLVSCMVIC